MLVLVVGGFEVELELFGFGGEVVVGGGLSVAENDQNQVSK